MGHEWCESERLEPERKMIVNSVCNRINVKRIIASASTMLVVWTCVDATALQESQEDKLVDAESSYRAITQKDQPVAYWKFDDRKENRFSAISPRAEFSALIHGNVAQLDGPQHDLYPLFSSDNRAAKFSGAGHLVVTDPGENSSLDFDLKDTITIEAWVRPEKIENGQYVYVVGKGRTHNKCVAADNSSAFRLEN